MAKLSSLTLLLGAAALAGCSSGTPSAGGAPAPARMALVPPTPDPRVGLKAGLMDAAEAAWNLKVVSKTPPDQRFLGVTNSDLAFSGNYAIQGNYNGWQIWDISNPAKPALKTAYYCPASQSDVSVYGNLLFVSGEGVEGRLDCAGTGVKEAVSKDRLRGLRIFDITDIANPKNVGNVQTCRGSHTHTVLEDPKDPENVYVYISGSAGVRAEEELPGCSRKDPSEDPNSALFRIEVIKVPVKNPGAAKIVSSPRIFNDLVAPPRHGETAQDREEQAKMVAEAKARGMFTAKMGDMEFVVPPRMAQPMLDSIVKARGATAASAADSAAAREAIQKMVAARFGAGPQPAGRPRPGPTQCHDITVYPAIGLAGGACEGYGLLLDIRDPANPRRIAAVADSNFSYWHSATFSNDGSKVLFTDEWGGGGAPKCRAADPKEWGANAIFTVKDGKMDFQSYYKLPAPQTSQENCVAHNGSLIPVPGRDIMVQAWYQGGISIFDWSDPKQPMEIAFHDRGPANAQKMDMGGSWSVYWYNGVIVSSEIARGLDIFELVPSPALSQNEIDAAKTVKFTHLNAQGQPKLVWPASFAKARAFADQLERSEGLSRGRISAVRKSLVAAENASGTARTDLLGKLASSLDADASKSKDAAKVKMLQAALKELS
ncbi:MAG: hypothetical protein NW201_03935 [Gemmatimonadales bacterium]|nr:hypothetical protein [Gemmatimonadales bacterium]